jgi:hypothetical protein
MLPGEVEESPLPRTYLPPDSLHCNISIGITFMLL